MKKKNSEYKTYINTLDDGFERPITMNYLSRRCTWNIQISPLTKITKLMPASYLIYLSVLRTKRNLVRGDFD